jgi:transcriptional regulator with XRE-family HTH domain
MSPEPAAPAEAALLYRARARKRLSVRVAALRAGVSENRWRQVEAGYQTVRKGVRVPANASAATLASMALVVGVTPERLEEEGQRPDAAVILREILDQEGVRLSDVAGAADSFTVVKSEAWLPPMTNEARISAARPYADAIWERMDDYRAEHPDVRREDIAGADLFPDSPADQRTWDDPNLRRNWSVPDRVWMLADIQRREAERNRQSEDRALGAG